MAKRKKRKKRRVSQARQEYMRERRRVSSIAGRLRKKGYNITLKDIAGDVPKRVTRKQINLLKEITGYKSALSRIKAQWIPTPMAPQSPSSGGSNVNVNPGNYIPAKTDAVIGGFIESLDRYDPRVKDSIEWFLSYLELEVGRQAVADAIEGVEAECWYLADEYGYRWTPEELELFLWRLVHMIASPTKSSLTDILKESTQLVQRYISSFSSWD